MKAKIRKDTIQGKEMLAVISFALAWSEHFIEDKKTYKFALEPKVYREIKSILPDVLKFCTNLSLDIMKDLSNKKDASKATVNTIDLYWTYRFATFYLEGVKEGVIKDKHNLINSSTFMFTHKIYEKADELNKEIEELEE